MPQVTNPGGATPLRYEEEEDPDVLRVSWLQQKSFSPRAGLFTFESRSLGTGVRTVDLLAPVCSASYSGSATVRRDLFTFENCAGPAHAYWIRLRLSLPVPVRAKAEVVAR
ncbi:hypothetical protein NDU88_007472 [Pleurodeles waltl]|uniref:Uncharacterized protein n=1 Tax=Pleurodeles waltl TaxID=8319 RepID=A0AAV7RU79_PLEWA|nr:hypothetical protein NDU88_007472 [Pleurodeles waltl]